MLLFLNCSLKSYLYEETLATLRFGNLAMTDPMLLNVMDNYRKKIKSLHSKINKYKHKSQNAITNGGGDTASMYSGKSNSSNDSNDEEKLKVELDKVRKEHRKNLKEMNQLKITQTQLIEENNQHQSMIDYQNSQIANMELGVIQIKDELLRSQTNEQLLRDENEGLERKLNEINAMKQNKLQYIDNNLMKRTSIIHSTLKRNMMNQKNDEQSKMIDELSQQIESLENLKAELKYEIQQKDDKINKLQKAEQVQHHELEQLRQEILNYRTNFIHKKESDIEIAKLYEQIKERDSRIHEYERDIKENLLHSTNWDEQQEAYEQQIKHLEQQLKDSKNMLQEQHEQIMTFKQKQSSHTPIIGTHQQQTSIDMLLKEKETQREASVSNQRNGDNGNLELIQELKEKIRNLKLENARIKSSEFKNEQIAKLKNKNNKLEERLIKARSEKAKMLPQLLQEKTELKSELMEMKTTLALYLVKWKFIEKRYIKRLRDCEKDLARYQRKLDSQIKGKRKLGNQMDELDRMAQKTVTKAIHERVISAIHVDQLAEEHHNVDANTHPTQIMIVDENQEQKAANVGIMQSTLPENLRRVQTVIDNLSAKLKKKNDKVGELEKKLAMYEFSMSQSVMAGRPSLGHQPSMMTMNQFMRNQSASIVGSQTPLTNGNGAQVGSTNNNTSETPTFTPMKVGVLNMNNPQFANFAATTTDLNGYGSTTNVGKEHLQLNPANNSSMMPDPAEYDATFTGSGSTTRDDSKEDDQFSNQEQYLQAFLKKQQQAMAPSPEKQLTLSFMINNRKNIRIAVDVNMTFWDILGELQVHQPSDTRNLELHVTVNPAPINDLISVTHDWMNKTFWDLILEFGFFSLLKFNVITNAAEIRQNTLQTPHKKKKRTTILSRLTGKSKKNVSK